MPVGAPSWSFTEDDAAAISESLRRFLADSNARCALLVDRAGQLVATAGEPTRFDETEFSSLVHRGERDSMYLADVARRIILVVIFDIRTTEGLVRLKAKGAVEELARLFTGVFGRTIDARAERLGLLAGADDEIDRLFQ